MDNQTNNKTEYASLTLRIGLALVLLYFGISQVVTPTDWTGWLPAWTASIAIQPESLILMHGIFEIILSVALITGFFTRIVAIITALHLLMITIDVGYSAVGVRDFGLTISAIALALLGSQKWTVNNLFTARRKRVAKSD